MSNAIMNAPAAETSPRSNARLAGAFYLITFVTGVMAFVSVSGRLLANLTATAAYVAVTILFYGLFKPVSKPVSLTAALFSLAGCAVGALASFRLDPLHINSLAFFGVYCLLIGYLILKSDFLPAVLGVLMMIGGVGWLTFASPALAKTLTPFNMAPGAIAEGILTVWLLVAGVDETRWREQARAQSQS